jgi:hypothetical protein
MILRPYERRLGLGCVTERVGVRHAMSNDTVRVRVVAFCKTSAVAPSSDVPIPKILAIGVAARAVQRQ